MRKYITLSLLIISIFIPLMSFAEVTTSASPTIQICFDLNHNLLLHARDVSTNKEVSSLQSFLHAKNFLKSEPTGYLGMLTLQAIKDFQKANGITPTGYVGPTTRAKLKALTCGPIAVPPEQVFCTMEAKQCPDGSYVGRSGPKCEFAKGPDNNSSSVTISGVSGPQKLAVGEQGTWVVKASSVTGGNLSYAVVWGDEVASTAQSPNGITFEQVTPVQQTGTFTHAYSSSGTYSPKFTVTSENTIRCITTPCPSNGGSAGVSLSVNVGGVLSSSLKLLTPNGGETWKDGTTQTIKWQEDNTWPPCALGVACGARPQRLYNLNLLSYYPPCTTNMCPMSAMAIRAPISIAKGVTGSSYDWAIPDCSYPYPCSTASAAISPGSYTVQICESGTDVCDTSDSYFKIDASTYNDGCFSSYGYSVTTGKSCAIMNN